MNVSARASNSCIELSRSISYCPILGIGFLFWNDYLPWKEYMKGLDVGLVQTYEVILQVISLRLIAFEIPYMMDW